MKKMMKQIICTGVLLFAMCHAAMAQTAQEALDTVKKSVAIVMQDLQANESKYKQNYSALDSMVDTKMLPYLDAKKMAILVLGKSWKNAAPAQRSAFINEFKQLMMRKYSSQLLDYTGAEFTYGDPTKVRHSASGSRTKIPVTIHSNGKTYPLLLSMGYSNGQWKAYDAKLSGVSLIVSFRSSVGMEVAQKGIDQVITEMKAQNAAGTVE